MIDISVIIPIFGKPHYLENAIKSVLNQTFKNIELIIVDDNDPDTNERKETEKLISSFMDKRLCYLKHTHNLNGAVARNTGIAQATGKYIAFLDSDDEYMPERLQKCFDIMENAPEEVAGVYTGCEFRKSGKIYHTHTAVKAGNFLLDTLACTFMFCTGSNIFVRKSVVEEINGFDETFLRHQDYEFLTRIFEKYSLDAISEVLVVKNNENMNLPDVEKMIDIKKKYIRKFAGIISKMPSDKQKYIYYSQNIQIVEAALRNKNLKVAKCYLKQAKQFSTRISKHEIFRMIGIYVKASLKR